MKTKYQNYKIEWSNGEIETVKVPSFFGPVDVVKRLGGGTLVSLIITDKQHAVCENVPHGFVEGPAELRVNEFGKLFN